MIRDEERNYTPRNWIEIDELPRDVQSLTGVELYRFCNADSQAFKDLCTAGRGDQAILLDYELINLGFDPTNESRITTSASRGLVLTIFTENGSRHFAQN